MESSRLPRFKRVRTVPPIELTERDRNIIRLLHSHRFLRSSHIVALLGGSPQQILRRLKLLYHHGYLERPRCQIDSYHKGGSQPIAYGLGNKGGTLLRQELGDSFRSLSWGEKNRAVGRMYLDHALLVSDVMVAIELACREKGIRLIHERELAPDGKQFRWRVKLQGGTKIGIVPDRVFALEFANRDGAQERAYFFLEADRGTMPVFRRSLSQTSFRRKLLAYEATWSQSLHRSKFGFNRFRVLTLTKSADRADSLVEACRKLARGHGLFLFADRSLLENPDGILLPLWRTGMPGERASLMD
jgi:hypothetical protein